MKTRYWPIVTALWLTGCAAPSRVVPIQCPPPPPIPPELSRRAEGSMQSQLRLLYQDLLGDVPSPETDSATRSTP